MGGGSYKAKKRMRSDREKILFGFGFLIAFLGCVFIAVAPLITTEHPSKWIPFGIFSFVAIAIVFLYFYILHQTTKK